MPSERTKRVRNHRGNTKVIVGEGASCTGYNHGDDYSGAGCPPVSGGWVLLKELWPMENQCHGFPQRRGKKDNVLVLPGVEVILFTAASMGLGCCPENSVDNIEIFWNIWNIEILKYFCYCWAIRVSIRVFSASHPTSPARRLRMQRIERLLYYYIVGTADPNWPLEYPTPYHIMFPMQSWEKEEKEEVRWMPRVMVFSSQVIVTQDRARLYWRWLKTCLVMRSGKLICCFAWLICTAFASPINLSLFQPTSFLTYMLLILSHIPPAGRLSMWLCVYYLWSGFKPWHLKRKREKLLYFDCSPPGSPAPLGGGRVMWIKEAKLILEEGGAYLESCYFTVHLCFSRPQSILVSTK